MASPFNGVARWLGGQLSRHLSQASHSHGTAAPTDPVKLMACLQPGDVLLVEGLVDVQGRPKAFVEADIREGVRAVSVGEFAGLHCRVCRCAGGAA